MKLSVIFNVLTFLLVLARSEPRLGFGTLENLRRNDIPIEPRLEFNNIRQRYLPVERRLGFDNLDIARKSNVNKDINDILNTLPKSKIEEIIKKWIANDEECKKDWNFATSEAAHNLVRQIEQSPEFMTVRHKLEGVHVDFVHFTNMVHEIINMEPMTRGGTTDVGGLRGALNEIRPTIPMTKIKLLVASKLVLSSQFRGLVKLALNKDFKKDVETLMNTPLVVNALNEAQANGIDLQAIYDFLHGITGYISEAVNIPN